MSLKVEEDLPASVVIQRQPPTSRLPYTRTVMSSMTRKMNSRLMILPKESSSLRSYQPEKCLQSFVLSTRTVWMSV